MPEEGRFGIILEAVNKAQPVINKMVADSTGSFRKLGTEVAKQSKIIYDAYGNIAKVVRTKTPGMKTDTEKMATSVNRLANSVKVASTNIVSNQKDMAKSSQELSTRYGEDGRKMRLTTTDLQLALGKLRNQLLLITFAYHTVKRFMIPVIEAAMNQEHAERRLEIAFRMRKKATDEQIQSLKDYAIALQLSTVYGDEEILSVMSLLTNFRLTTRQIKEAVPVILDVARSYSDLTGESLDLEGVTRGLGRALSGEGLRALQQLGIHIPKTVKDSKDFKSILEAIKKVTSDSSKSMNTLNDEMKKFKGYMTDIAEKIGLEIVPKMNKFVGAINRVIEARTRLEILERKIEKGEIREEVISPRIKKILEARKILEQVYTEAGKTMRESLLGPISKAIGPVVSIVYEKLTGVGEKIKEINVELEKLIVAPEAGIEKAKSAWESFREWLENHRARIEETFSKIGDAFEKTFSDVLFDAIVGEFKTFEDYVRAFGREVIRIFTDVIASIIRTKIAASLAGAFFHAGGVVAHAGGLISKGGRHKHFDAGGRAMNEVNATLLTGEGVLSRRGMRALAALNRGEGLAGGDTYVIINAIDTESFRERLLRHGDIYETAALGAASRGGGYRRRLREVLG